MLRKKLLQGDDYLTTSPLIGASHCSVDKSIGFPLIEWVARANHQGALRRTEEIVTKNLI